MSGGAHWRCLCVRAPDRRAKARASSSSWQLAGAAQEIVVRDSVRRLCSAVPAPPRPTERAGARGSGLKPKAREQRRKQQQQQHDADAEPAKPHKRRVQSTRPGRPLSQGGGDAPASQRARRTEWSQPADGGTTTTTTGRRGARELADWAVARARRARSLARSPAQLAHLAARRLTQCRWHPRLKPFE